MEVKVQLNNGIVDVYWFDPQHEQSMFEYYENLYYKSRIQTFWLDGVEYQEPTD